MKYIVQEQVFQCLNKIFIGMKVLVLTFKMQQMLNFLFMHGIHNLGIIFLNIIFLFYYYRHRFCHKGTIRLLDAFFVDQLSGNRVFSLNLEPSGSLLIQICFDDMAKTFSRHFTTENSNNMFGIPLEQIIKQDQLETPIGLSRLIQEIEERGVDTPGLYYCKKNFKTFSIIFYLVCGANERKLLLRELLKNDSRNADLNIGPVPDVNLLTCLVKDFLRELPTPLIPLNIYSMLVDAGDVLNVTADKEDNQKFILRIIDCLQIHNKVN